MNHTPLRLTVAAMLLACAAPALAQRNLRDIPDPDPQKQLDSFRAADGFEVELFASDPTIAKPIQMNWDARGRLWVATSETYPQLAPGEVANDKIIILEDTTGDGRADQRTVFADGLLIPTGIAPDHTGHGAYVANSTELLHLSDTTGDGRADQRRVVLSGFGTEDTHHILHTLRWGPDGQLYMNQSIYIHSHVETPWGPRRLNAGGIWRFRPETMQLEVFLRGGINFWGHQFDRWGQSFVTDGAFSEGINYGFPGAAFTAAEDVSRILRGLNSGQPKHCGLAVLSGRHLPEELRGTLLTNDFRGHRVNRFTLADSGSAYASRQAPDLLATDHIAFRPVDSLMGPDGAIYIADWYNPIIQHGEVDFRDDRRDKERGRIWRITAKDRPLVDPPDLIDAPVEELLDALKLPEQWTRDQARLVLKGRGADEVLTPLADWIDRLDEAHEDYEHHRLEALWVHQSLGEVNPEASGLLRAVLGSPDHRARAAAVRVLFYWQDRVSDAMELLEAAVTDEHPRVRLEALHALREAGTADAARLALRALDRPMDRFLDYSLWLTTRELEDQWLARVLDDPGYFSRPHAPREDPRLAERDGHFADVSHLLYALRAIERPEALDPLVELWRRGEVPDEQRQPVAELIAGLGGPGELEIVFDLALDADADPAARAALLEALDDAARRRDARPAGDLGRITTLLDDPEPRVRIAAAPLAGRWGVEAARDPLLQLITGAEHHGARLGRAGIDGLALLGGERSRDTLLDLTRDEHPLDLRMQAVVGFASLDPDAAARRAVAILAEAPAGTDPAPVFDALLAHEDGPAALNDALRDATLPAGIASAGLRAVTIAARDLPADLADNLQRAGGIEPVDQSLTDDQLQALLAEVDASGDPDRGELMYRRESLLCTTCHAIGGAGGLVGPDLASLGAASPPDYIVQALVDPQQTVKEGFHVTTVTKTDGSAVGGVLQQRTGNALHLRDASDQQIVIPLDEVESQTLSPVSLMPPGLTAQLSRDQFVDLVRFLSELGRTDRFTVSHDRTVRRWRALESGGRVAHQLRRHSTAYAAGDDPDFHWKPAYSLVSGELPITDAPPIQQFAGQQFRFVRFEVRVLSPGSVALRFNSPDAIDMWVADQPVHVREETIVDLPAGTHTFTLSIEAAERGDTPLRIDLIDAPDSPAQAELIGGK